MPMLADQLFTVMSAQHKYILHTGGDDEFFDLDSDPNELLNEIGTSSAARYRDLITVKLNELEWAGLASTTEQAELPADVLEELKALGYVR